MAKKQSVGFTLQPGSLVSWEGKNYRILQVSSLSEVTLIDPNSGQLVVAQVDELKPVFDPTDTHQDLSLLDGDKWQKAIERYEKIEPMLSSKMTKQQVVEHAKNVNVHPVTLYRWLKQYQKSGLLTDLMTSERVDKGTKKLSSEVEAIIQQVIQADYLNAQKKRASVVCREVSRICHERGLDSPNSVTIYNRIKTVKGKEADKKREGKKAAQQFDSLHGGTIEAKWPLSVVEMDHTLLDIILCDEQHRLPIGRPYITLAFDVYSRMVLGFYISFDPAGSLSSGLCLSHAMLDKSMWLAKTEVIGDWPCWGLIDKLHMDNANEFRGNMIKKACQQYGITVEWRPVARPHFGAHIERYLGTMAKEIHNLPGTTFSNVRQRGEYNSEGKAVMTLPELEAWITEYIVNYYHHQFHSGIDSTPFARYQKGILGDATTPGKGLPRRVSNPERFRLDFMPFFEATVQRYGVRQENIFYFHDVLRRWINAKDPVQPKLKRQFLFRYDPRDISVIWFYDPDTGSYHKIPYRNTSYPAMSVWELRRIRAELKKNNEPVNEAHIFSALKRLKQIEEQASFDTKMARKAQQRRMRHEEAKHYVQSPSKANVIPSTAHDSIVDVPSSDSGFNWQNIQPFDDLDAGL